MEHTERPRRARHRRAEEHPDDGTDLALEAGHGHGHGHGPAPPAGRRIRIIIACLLVPAVLATLAGLVLLFPTAQRPTGAAASPRVDGHVTTASETACDVGQEPTGCVALTIALTDGPLPGREIVVVVSKVRGNAPFGAGDDVVLVQSGDDPADPASYDVTDFQRDTPIQLLAVLFAIAVVTLGRWRGFAALVALGLTGVVLIMFVLPAILDGRDPLLVAIVGSCAIMFGVLYLTHGFSARTSTAVLGTLLSLVLIGVLGAAFAAAARLTGDGEDTASLSAALGTSVDGRGLVLAGLVIGALGALDDVTVTQTSAVWELRRANPQLGPAALFGAAMRIGRDHVASAVNTLVLAYAGAALPLLLLYSVAERGLGETLTAQVIATEVVRTLVGSIGIVASVPITTLLAVAVVNQERTSAT
ncbi:YibE/F family protein [Pseudonocardia sp. TRM90224]|uniref:YibE/F family protein n=1 Tax=Pseudonocardia sp. TRM90224 TaxID=2812678 RepID=UPI001E616B10|nr:YibE/F family protein [Pseudonocardia sp. TRM90224]